MARRLGDLANRMRAAVADHERDAADRAEAEKRASAEKSRSEADERARRVAAERARDELMGELAAFGEGLGFAKIEKDLPRSVLIAWSGRQLGLRAEQGDRIAVVGGPEGAHLTRDSLGEWEVVFPEEGGVRRLPLDLGLEELLVSALGVPSPKGAARPKEAAKAAPAKKKKADEAPKATVTVSKKEVLMPGPSVKTYKGPFD
jgi:hypothetical protein